MNDFEKCFNITIDFETGGDRFGGYVNNPSDPGGETKWGISKRTFPDKDIKNLTLNEAKNIYHQFFWDLSYGDLLPYPLCLLIFDFSVHSGVSRSVTTLQKLLKVKVDGIIGEKTLEAISENELKNLCLNFNIERTKFICELIKGNPRFLVFLTGWMLRVIKLTATMGE